MIYFKDENYHILEGFENENSAHPFVLVNFVIFVACIFNQVYSFN
jgi:hypothetical protein